MKLSVQLLNLPIHVPWKLIAVSPDMMDTQFCDHLFPFAFRTSLAISAYEPKPEDLPDDLCEGRITYLKVTCTITGYQIPRGETVDVTTILDSFESDDDSRDLRGAIDRILSEYLACYGALINVAVFPLGDKKKVLVESLIDFGAIDNTRPGTKLPNPFEHDGAVFEAVDRTVNVLVDHFPPPDGDTNAEFDLAKKTLITFLPGIQVAKVTARIAHGSAAGVTMEAFSGMELIGTAAAGLEQGQIHELSISVAPAPAVFEMEGIDRVVLTAPENEAWMLDFSYFSIQEAPVERADYPHIIDFEPKRRDLYQASTETGELLTQSHSGIKTDKTLTRTESTESGIELGAEVPVEKAKLTGKLSLKRTDTDQEGWAVHTDASRERRETTGATTQLSQMYNLLTGYHKGTNRAVFLMLARPHVLQPTDFRTFVHGLRAIEGIQEFFLVVARPINIEGLCVEAFLETGNFPEDAEIVVPTPEYDEQHFDFVVNGDASGSGGFWVGEQCTELHNLPGGIQTVPVGWVVDRRIERRRQGDLIGSGWDPNHPGVAELDRTGSSVANYNYQASDESVTISGRICGDSGLTGGDDAHFEGTYRVFLRSEQPLLAHEQPYANVGRLLVTSRGLCVCFKSGDCPEVVPLPEPPVVLKPVPGDWIVDEPVIQIHSAQLTAKAQRESRTPLMKEFVRRTKNALAMSWRSPQRYPLYEVSFLDSEFFNERIRRVLPDDYLKRRIDSIPDLSRAFVAALGEDCTVANTLDMDLLTLAKKTGLSVKEAGIARRRLFGISPKGAESEGSGGQAQEKR